MTLIDEREKTHGPFSKTAKIYYGLINAISAYDACLSPTQLTALYMDMMKTARILSGNANEPDHWRDKAGYAELVVRELEAGK